jgi:diguanylate cyclase (GGDEF)-like protein
LGGSEPDRGQEGLSGRASWRARLVDPLLSAELRSGDPVRLQRTRTLVGLTYVLALLGLQTGAFFYWALPSEDAVWLARSMAGALALVALVPVVVRRAPIGLAANLLLAGTFSVLLALLGLLGGIHAPVLHWLAVPPMLALLMAGRRSAIAWACASGSALLLFAALPLLGIEAPDRLVLQGSAQVVQRVVDTGAWIVLLAAVAALHAPPRDERTAEPAVRSEALHREVVQRRPGDERTRYRAYYDPLTRLPNRELFREQLRDAIDLASAEGGRTGVLFLDLDGFEEINDVHGRALGDQLLQHVARRLANCVRGADSVSRAAEDASAREGVTPGRDGDEFTFVLADIRGHEEAAIVARRILKALARPLDLEGHEVSISASIGVALYPSDGEDLDGLLRHAHLAMRHAKERGKNNYQFFDEALNDAAQRRAAVAGDLRRAIEREEFALLYQPILDAATGRYVGVEALLRWDHPERGRVAPGEFIEIAEETGLVVQIGRWVLSEACRQWRAWKDADVPSLRLSINVSGVQMKDRELPRLLADTLARCDMPGKSLELEITENAMMEDEEEASRSLEELKREGVRVALDDFGTGYSSLSYVKRFPVDAIKIDRSFVADVCEDPEARAITSAIIALAHELDLTVIAEGVETEAQERSLARLGCDQLQGYRFGRPLEPHALATLVTEHAAAREA